jgi:uncharacterized protein (TIGR02453 family)
MQPASFKFLKGLRRNNNKEWFDKHRADYESARNDFASVVQQAIDLHAKKDPSIKLLLAKDCMFRINRDVRFSKDKSPYKLNFGASINKNGRKAWQTAGYYIHFEPGKSFAGGGMYMPEAPLLKKVRQEIDYNFKAFSKLLSEKKFRTVYKDLVRSGDIALTRVPKGYEPGNEAAEYLKLKSFIATVHIPDAVMQSKNAAKEIAAAFAALQPLISFLNEAAS